MLRQNQWIYPDVQLAPSIGVTYELRYVGAMPIMVSIKTLDLETCTKLTQYCIRRVCDDVGIRPISHQPDTTYKSILDFVGPTTDKQWAMSNVFLTITSRSLCVEQFDSNRLMFRHSLNAVSFASGGDPTRLDFICYVAKSDSSTTTSTDRLCYVFDCPGGLAHEVILTIRQAFQLGYQDYKRKASNSSTNSAKPHIKELVSSTGANPLSPSFDFSHLSDDNVVPSTTDSPAQLAICPPPVPSRLNWQSSDEVAAAPPPARQDSPEVFDDDDPLIDDDDKAWLLERDTFGSTGGGSCNPNRSKPPPKLVKPPDRHAPAAQSPVHSKQPSQSPSTKPVEPVGEPWYVGKMSRFDAERLLRYDGDFLVRASNHQPGQFVLSGLQDGSHKHLLLADSSGQIRTRERVFTSIQHLIDYHLQNGAPIRSPNGEIRLIFPVSTHFFA